jgi:hypothetical protein
VPKPWEAEADRLAREAHIHEQIQRLTCDGDVERFIGRYNLGAIGRGRQRGRGQNSRLTYILCPFHQEKHASFVFWAAHVTKTGRVHCNCFGCQWSGDLVALAAHLFGVTREELLADPIRWGW